MQGNAGQLASAVSIGARGDGSVMPVPDVKRHEDPVSNSRQISFLFGKKITKHLIIISNDTNGFELGTWNFQAFIPKIYMEFLSFLQQWKRPQH